MNSLEVPDGDLLHTALTRLQRMTSVQVAFGGQVDQCGHLSLERFRGTRTNALRGVNVRSGTGVGGRAVKQQRPVLVTDYTQDAGISHHYDPLVIREGLRSVAAVPVFVRGGVAVVLYAGQRHAFPLGDRALASAITVAQWLGQELTVRGEVATRMARVEAEAGKRVAEIGRRLENVRTAHALLRSVQGQDFGEDLRNRLDEVEKLLAGAVDDPDGQPSQVDLSRREVDVLALVAVGCTNAAAADRLGLATETVKAYLRSASRKLGAHGRHEAVVLARRAGLLP